MNAHELVKLLPEAECRQYEVDGDWRITVLVDGAMAGSIKIIADYKQAGFGRPFVALPTGRLTLLSENYESTPASVRTAPARVAEVFSVERVRDGRARAARERRRRELVSPQHFEAHGFDPTQLAGLMDERDRLAAALSVAESQIEQWRLDAHRELDQRYAEKDRMP